MSTGKRGTKVSLMPDADPVQDSDYFHLIQGGANTKLMASAIRVFLDGTVNTILHGEDDPFPTDGIDGDFWINTTTWHIFGPKGESTAGLWPAGQSLVGNDGGTTSWGLIIGNIEDQHDLWNILMQMSDVSTALDVRVTALEDTRVLRAGDVMTGNLQLPGTMTDPLHAAHKNYVDDRMRYRGVWVAMSYLKNDVVLDDNWQMIANKDTEDRAAPQPVGDTATIYQGASPTTATVAKSVLNGLRTTIQPGGAGYITGWRVYTIAGNKYSTYTINEPNGIAVIDSLLDFEAVTTGWQTFLISPVLLQPGQEFDIVSICREPNATPTVWTGNWDYTLPNNEIIPVAGDAAHSTKTLGVIRFAKVDNNAGDRGAELLALSAGDVIHGPTLDWAIQSVSDGGSYVEFGVSPAVQDIATTNHNFEFETVTPTPITYVSDTGYWDTAGLSNVRGLVSIDQDYSSVIPDANAYGIDLLYQLANISEDWDALSAPEGGGSSGGVGGVSAGSVTYDNVSSGLTSDNVQGAIDEIDATVDKLVGWEYQWTNNALITLPKLSGPPKLYGVHADTTIRLPAGGVVAVGSTYAFFSNNIPGAPYQLDFDEATNSQTIVVGDDSAKTWRGNGCIITITYFGGGNWLLYGELADA